MTTSSTQIDLQKSADAASKSADPNEYNYQTIVNYPFNQIRMKILTLHLPTQTKKWEN